MGLVHSGGDLFGDRHRGALVQGPVTLQPRLQRLAVQIVHDQEDEVAIGTLIDVQEMDLAHVGMRDAVGELDVAAQQQRQVVQSRQPGTHDLHGDPLGVIGVLKVERFVYLAHAADAKTTHDSETAIDRVAVLQPRRAEHPMQEWPVEERGILFVQRDHLQNVLTQTLVGWACRFEVSRALRRVSREGAFEHLLR